MFKKIKLIKKAYIKSENKYFCLFITVFVIINIFFNLFLYTSCRGIAYNNQGRFAVGMDNSFFDHDTIFFYDEKGELISSADINNDGRAQARMYYNSEYVCYQVRGDVYYYDYNGAILNDMIKLERIDGNIAKCGYLIENDRLSIVHKKHLGLEYIIYKGNETRIHIYFKVFLCKILWLLFMIPFVVYVISVLKKAMNNIDENKA